MVYGPLGLDTYCYMQAGTHGTGILQVTGILQESVTAKQTRGSNNSAPADCCFGRATPGYCGMAAGKFKDYDLPGICKRGQVLTRYGIRNGIAGQFRLFLRGTLVLPQ